LAEGALTDVEARNTVVASFSRSRNVRWARAVVVAVLASLLVIATAAPAISAQRLRVYKGETSQGETISFHVARTENGRFIREMRYGVTLTCEDQTTIGVGIGWGLAANSLPITDRAFSFDVVFQTDATHLAGELGKLRGSGTLLVNWAGLTAEEQPQLCTTGDLAWTVEYVRTITRPRF
jgi:hypothetical protein